MSDLEDNIVTSSDGLAALYEEPIEHIATKDLDYINAAGRAFIAASPFLVLATASQQGLDCSPKGDRPGFVEVADNGRTLFIPDRRGNNRIDGLKNILEDPRVALIFFVPGANETYRVNGRVRISADAGRQTTLCCQRQGTGDCDGRNSRTSISALPESADAIQLMEGGERRPASRRANPRRLRSGPQAGHKRCRLRRRTQRTLPKATLLRTETP